MIYVHKSTWWGKIAARVTVCVCASGAVVEGSPRYTPSALHGLAAALSLNIFGTLLLHSAGASGGGAPALGETG